MHKVYSSDITTEEKSKLWADIVEDFLQSDMSQKKYSELNGLAKDHLSYYSRKYKKTTRTDVDLPKQDFIPVEFNSSATVINSNYIIKIDNISLQLPSSHSITQIISIVKELRGAIC